LLISFFFQLDVEGRAPIHLAAEFSEKNTLLFVAKCFLSSLSLPTGTTGETVLHIVAHRKV
jgi:hypothetical protein